MEYSLFHVINSMAGHFDAIDDSFEMLAAVAPFVLVAFLLGLWFWPGARVERDLRQWACVSAAAAATVGLGINHIIGMMWYRPRPFVDHQATLLIPHSADGSFPSDHTVFAFAIAVSIVLVNRRLGLVALVIAGAMAFARVYIGVHYVSDVLVGAAIGTVAALGMFQLRMQAAPLMDPPMRLLRRMHLG
ncbi:MAG: phosphatase PAP2 family protein [Thermomicrobiales bacterium]|nr:phosphatase PAP2 family protein [Thermomicrobiales bacterium]